MKNPNISEAVIEDFCRAYLDGWSIRALVRRFKIPRSTIHSYIVKRLGKGRQQPNRELMAVLQEYLILLPTSQRNEIRRWMAQNRQTILQPKGDRPQLLTSQQERNRTIEECWARRDFRHVADEIHWRDGDAA